MNMRMNHLICHPEDMPLELSLLQRQSEQRAELGELLVHDNTPISIGREVRLKLSVSGQEAAIDGQVVWRGRDCDGYLLGIAFHSEDEAFRMRMIEQLCYITLYREEVYLREGRLLSEDEAANEWIRQFSDGFPKVTLARH